MRPRLHRPACLVTAAAPSIGRWALMREGSRHARRLRDTDAPQNPEEGYQFPEQGYQFRNWP